MILLPSGQQSSQENYKAFLAWVSSKTDRDLATYAHRGKLKRTAIARECGFGRSALNQNPLIRKSLAAIELRLLSDGLLESVATTTAVNGESRDCPSDLAEHRAVSKAERQIKALQEQNASLNAQLTEAKQLLKRYALLEEFIVETGRLL